jgi:hypothetical protein
MSPWGTVWLVLATGSAILFFGIAVVVAWRGAKDLRDLLRGSRRTSGSKRAKP